MKITPILLLSLIVGCASGSSSNPGEDTGGDPPDLTEEGATGEESPGEDTGLAIEGGEEGGDTGEVVETGEELDPAEWFTFEAGPFTVPAGTERFYCHTYTLEEDLWVDEIAIEAPPFVHHAVYSRTTSADPDGITECDVLFQNNWVPIFISGTGNAAVTMPEGSGHVLEKGTQLTLQLHLLNVTGDDITDTVPVRFHTLASPPDEEVQVVVFGDMNIALPPFQESEVVGECASDSDMEIFAGWPHMHLLGTHMVVEMGPDADSLEEVFRRDPYVFDDQAVEPLSLSVKAGDAVRVTCGYNNPSEDVITFGESTTNEMCFFIGFATKASHQLSGCIGTSGTDTSSFLPDTCGDDAPNDIGLGATCSKGGGECEGSLLCSEDIEQLQGLNLCLGLGCNASADCGEGGVCCAIAAAGGLTLCLPPSCMFSLCEAVD
jgi:hypothetical protein